MQYGDDIVIFLEDDPRFIQGINIVLKLFEIMSGLKIKFHKSFIYGPKDNNIFIRGWASKLGCNIGTWPIQYLGASIGLDPQKLVFWEPLINKIHGKLKCFKGIGTSIAGRIVLLKAVLDSIPIYWLNLYKLPIAIIKKIDKFVGILSGMVFFLSLIKFTYLHGIKCVLIKAMEGWEYLLSKRKNLALFAKWWWRYRAERGSLWNQVLTNKYGN